MNERCRVCGQNIDPATCDFQQGRCVHRVKPPFSTILRDPIALLSIAAVLIYLVALFGGYLR